MFRRVLAILVWLCVYGGIGYGVYALWYLPNVTAASNGPLPEERAWSIRALTAKTETHRLYRNLRGVVVYDVIRELSFSQSGCIASVRPDLVEGAVVAKGEVLATLDSAAAELALQTAEQAKDLLTARLNEGSIQLDVARSRKARALNEVGIAERQLARQRTLFDNKLLSQATMDQMEQDRLAVQNRADTATENVAIAEGKLVTLKAEQAQTEIAINEAKLALRDVTLRAPARGVVLSESLSETNCVAAFVPLLTLTQPNRKAVEISLNTMVLDELARYSPLSGRAVQFLEPYEDCSGQVDRVETSDNRTSSVTVRTSLNSECSARLSANAAVPVRLAVREIPDAIRLPISAEWDAGQIFVVEENRLRTRTVYIAARDEDWLYVTDGLDPNEAVLTSRPDFAVEGQLVKVVGP